MGKPPRGTKGVSLVVAKTAVDRVDTHYLTERLVSHIQICSFFTMQLTVKIPPTCGRSGRPRLEQFPKLF